MQAELYECLDSGLFSGQAGQLTRVWRQPGAGGTVYSATLRCKLLGNAHDEAGVGWAGVQCVSNGGFRILVEAHGKVLVSVGLCAILTVQVKTHPFKHSSILDRPCKVACQCSLV